MSEKFSRERSSSMVRSATMTSSVQPLPAPRSDLTDAEAIAVAGVDASAAIEVLATEAQGTDVASATAVLEGLAKQISAALAAATPPAPVPVPSPTLPR